MALTIAAPDVRLFIDVEKADGRILRYHIEEDPPCPRCGSTGCKSKFVDGKENDWIRICQNCGHEFSLIEVLPGKNKQSKNRRFVWLKALVLRKLGLSILKRIRARNGA
jgi:hypothetical protein